ncbi:hypothetical protein Skr01_07700 [Sphaerisporangium krabiense]|uniref:Secreted protein n=1 Tax=Sphaerisporangium krabiense TaxID=763782 RepID=A0A7W8ZD01_9ACTN|nr:hypothetical protein [Sphaerisporangium krabiense]MBB5631676.1 hypothetical protein [Sphaerisporangium krabiense]GII60685.1 hypothetical protein Skr01_07700 [Sphaerisporangium krabiense]
MHAKKLWTLGAVAAACCAGLATIAAAPASGAATVPAPAPAAVRPAADFTGYQIVKLPNANVPNFQRRTVYCPNGKRAVGGGAEAQGNDAVLVGSFPTEDGKGWIGLGRQNRYADVGISVYAICAAAS